ncbi:hypothetical protein BU15DRAFT_62134 [Melanogaster broomeanus]|nr:hypothetical protein BU15DRAFT_62134 [Melanogaster broomeanus]
MPMLCTLARGTVILPLRSFVTARRPLTDFRLSEATVILLYYSGPWAKHRKHAQFYMNTVTFLINGQNSKSLVRYLNRGRPKAWVNEYDKHGPSSAEVPDQRSSTGHLLEGNASSVIGSAYQESLWNLESGKLGSGVCWMTRSYMATLVFVWVNRRSAPEIYIEYRSSIRLVDGLWFSVIIYPALFKTMSTWLSCPLGCAGGCCDIGTLMTSTLSPPVGWMDTGPQGQSLGLRRVATSDALVSIDTRSRRPKPKDAPVTERMDTLQRGYVKSRTFDFCYGGLTWSYGDGDAPESEAWSCHHNHGPVAMSVNL